MNEKRIAYCVEFDELRRPGLAFVIVETASLVGGTCGRWRRLGGEGGAEMREDAARRVGRRVESRPRGHGKQAPRCVRSYWNEFYFVVFVDAPESSAVMKVVTRYL